MNTMNADEYEYNLLLSAYRQLTQAKGHLGNAGNILDNANQRDRSVKSARADLRALDAYQPTEAEVRKVIDRNDPTLVDWIRRSRPTWES